VTRLRLTLVIAAMSGFIALSYEILWYRAFAFVSWGHPTVFGLLLGFYLLGVAFGSFGSRRWCVTTQSAEEDSRRLRALAAFIFLADLVGFLVIPMLSWFATKNWVPALGLVSLSAGLMGAVLPLVAHYGIPADDRAGANLSYVYLANIIGSTSGSFLTGFVLMDAWSTRGISVALALVGLAMVALLVVASAWGVRRAPVIRSLAGVLAAGVACVASSPPLFDKLYERLLMKNTYTPSSKLVHVLENRHGVIVVNQLDQVYGGGAYDGAFNISLVDNKNVVQRAFAVGALHPSPKKILMIGLSSGSWAQIIAHLPGVEDMTVVEINPGYLDLIAKYPAVASLLTNPKVHIVIDDGRRWLLRHPPESGAKFDVLVMNTTWHWRAHITNLLSKEFLELARAHLLPGGIHYFNTTSSDEAQRTAATVFPHAMRVINFMAVSDSPLVFDKGRWNKILSELVIEGLPVLDLTNEHHADLLQSFLEFADTQNKPVPYEYWGLETRDAILERTKGAAIITDDNMACEWNDPLKFPLEAE
jgi:spermidine synthase